MMNIGSKVTRVASDYTNGRQGDVIEIDAVKGRARVLWTHTPSGAPMKLRTWVRFADLREQTPLQAHQAIENAAGVITNYPGPLN